MAGEYGAGDGSRPRLFDRERASRRTADVVSCAAAGSILSRLTSSHPIAGTWVMTLGQVFIVLIIEPHGQAVTANPGAGIV
jgi:hypothetical protein